MNRQDWRQLMRQSASLLNRLGLLAAGHLWMSLHIIVAMGFWLGLAYLFLPPLALMAVALQLGKFTTFSLATGMVWIMLCLLLLRRFPKRLARLPAVAFFFLAPLPAVWLSRAFRRDRPLRRHVCGSDPYDAGLP